LWYNADCIKRKKVNIMTEHEGFILSGGGDFVGCMGVVDTHPAMTRKAAEKWEKDLSREGMTFKVESLGEVAYVSDEVPGRKP
jgi:hypothetical protein